jgi:hypothetical protein
LTFDIDSEVDVDRACTDIPVNMSTVSHILKPNGMSVAPVGAFLGGAGSDENDEDDFFKDFEVTDDWEAPSKTTREQALPSKTGNLCQIASPEEQR